ncbi:MAG: CobW family GTP-binding protein [Alkalispirochaetaceae bacterium]
MSESSRPLWIVSGFLGTGKTTLLNHLLREFAPDPVGVLVNDFGTLGVDAHLISPDAGTPVVELNGGQIFCSCLSGSFVDALVRLSAAPVSGILVEASGMAKPRALAPIIEEARNRSEHRFYYAGLVTVVDAPRFDKMLATVNAVEEQIVYADLVVINKCDAGSENEIAAVARAVGSLNPHCGIVRTDFGRVRREELPERPVASLERRGPAGEKYEGWDNRKPVVVSWNPPGKLTRRELKETLREKAASALRIKGYLETDEGPVFVSAVGANVAIEEVSAIPGLPGVVEFYPNNGEGRGATVETGRVGPGAESCET